MVSVTNRYLQCNVIRSLLAFYFSCGEGCIKWPTSKFIDKSSWCTLGFVPLQHKWTIFCLTTQSDDNNLTVSIFRVNSIFYYFEGFISLISYSFFAFLCIKLFYFTLIILIFSFSSSFDWYRQSLLTIPTSSISCVANSL